MKNDSNSYYALDGFYRSIAIISALIISFLFFAAPAEANYIYDHNTGAWVPTSGTIAPPSGTTSVSRPVPPASNVWGGGGFTSKGGINSTFPNVPKTVPITVNARVPPSAVANAAKSVLKGGVGAIVLGAGLNMLLDELGAFIDEAGQVVMKEDPPSQPCTNDSACYNGYYPYTNSTSQSQTASGACSDLIADLPIHSCSNAPDFSWFYTSVNIGGIGQCYAVTEYHNNFGNCTSAGSIRRAEITKTASGTEPLPSIVPVPPDVIDDAVDSSYSPTDDDYPALAPSPFMAPTITEVEPIPRQAGAPNTTTTIDLDTGVTTTVETNIWHDFNIAKNPSAKPEVSVETTTTTDVYKDGNKTSTSTSTTTKPADPSAPASNSGSASTTPEIPTDCDLFPTACAWMEWTKEEPQEPEDNLSDLLKEVPITKETFTITGGAATCPAPIVLNLSQFGSREVSYQPLCDLASTMKFLYLALMSFAAAVLLHRSISRV